MQIGSEAHKELFCRTFIDGHKPYEPEALPWPDLQGEDLAKLRNIPFWTPALEAEKSAGPMLELCAKNSEDPLVREAIALQAYEESRHAGLIRHMLERYEVDFVEPPDPEEPADAEAAFIDFGYEECLDSFGAFGIYELARQAEYLPEGFFTIFENIVQEEATHIVFFVNWYSYLLERRGRPPIYRETKALWHYVKAVWRLVGFGLQSDRESNSSFTATGGNTFVKSLTPTLFLSTCLRENDRRLGAFDPRLVRPRLASRLARFGLAGLKVLPPYGRRPPEIGPGSSAAH